MRENALPRRLTVEEYLELELRSPVRHEYVRGEAFRMAGETTRHNFIVLNIVTALRAAAKARGCRVFAEGVMVRASQDRFFYPDVLAACGDSAYVERIVEQPTVVVEVTSPSTRSTDRREKLEAYQQIPSLRTYVIVEQRRQLALVYTRVSARDWTREEFVGTGTITIPSLGASLTLDSIYEDVPMPPLTVGEQLSDDPWAFEDEDEADDEL